MAFYQPRQGGQPYFPQLHLRLSSRSLLPLQRRLFRSAHKSPCVRLKPRPLQWLQVLHQSLRLPHRQTLPQILLTKTGTAPSVRTSSLMEKYHAVSSHTALVLCLLQMKDLEAGRVSRIQVIVAATALTTSGPSSRAHAVMDHVAQQEHTVHMDVQTLTSSFRSPKSKAELVKLLAGCIATVRVCWRCPMDLSERLSAAEAPAG
jgi:hypothetical protein